MTDKALGEAVGAYLRSIGVETPMVNDAAGRFNVHTFGDGTRGYHTLRDGLEYYIKSILETLGLDLADDSLKGTPERVAKMFMNETFRGLDYANFPRCTVIQNKMHAKDEFIIESGIQINSVCEHHLVTIDGKATIAYIPKEKVLGLSKMNRIADFFARRPQVQERLTVQIAEALAFVVESPDVAVFIDAVHYCVKARGIRDVSSRTATFHGKGRFADIGDPIRREFMERSRG